MLWHFFSLPGIENGIEYRYFSRYRIEVRNSSIVTTLLHITSVQYKNDGYFSFILRAVECLNLIG